METRANFFSSAGGNDSQEHFQTLLEQGGVRIERIESFGHASAEGYWFDQSEDEWVMLVRGSALLEYRDGERADLGAGDHLFIPRHRQHRVAEVSRDALWLAVHLK